MRSLLRALEDGAFRRALEPGPRTRAALIRAADLLFPPFAFDGGARPQTTGWSAEGWTQVRFLEEPVCDACGLPFEYDQGEGALCPACQSRRPTFQRARAACLYDHVSRELILPFKHADRTDLAPLFARWIARSAAALVREAEVVVPVPLHPWRLLGRRYNQAAEIARPLARTADAEYLADALVRRRDTGSQGGRTGSGRRRNVRGAFVVRPSARKRLRGRRVLLVDDVLTTGATAEACAKALLAAGARAVDVAVVARVPQLSI